MNLLTLLLILFQSAVSLKDRRVITTLKHSHFRVKPVVVDGRPVGNDQVPFLASIKDIGIKIDKKNFKWENLCGGSIISEAKVLTAAHCFEENDFYYTRRLHLLGVSAGTIYTNIVHDGMPVSTDAGQWRNVQKLTLHPDYLYPLNDIAVVYVKPGWVFTSFIKPIPISKLNTDYPSECFIAGYGRKSFGNSSGDTDVLLRASIRLFTKSQCSVIWQMDMSDHVCTDARLGEVSTGDSGSPLICYGTIEEGENPLLVGLVSGKNYDKTTLFTRVSKYESWLQQNNSKGFKIEACSLILLITSLLLYLVFYSHRAIISEINLKCNSVDKDWGCSM